jgi:hypothetical protein
MLRASAAAAATIVRGNKLLVPAELRLLEEIRTAPIPDASAASIRLIPSDAITALLESQEPIFGPANSVESRMLLTRLDTIELDDLAATYAEIENKIEQVARTLMEKVIIGTSFDLDRTAHPGGI